MDLKAKLKELNLKLKDLKGKTREELMDYEGIGEATADAILAEFEKEKEDSTAEALTGNADVTPEPTGEDVKEADPDGDNKQELEEGSQYVEPVEGTETKKPAEEEKLDAEAEKEADEIMTEIDPEDKKVQEVAQGSQQYVSKEDTVNLVKKKMSQ